MGIREKVNQGQRGTVLGIGAITLLALSAAVYQLWPTTPNVSSQESFYSDDDGKTFFRDSIFKFPPFDHDGKVANRAFVFASEGVQPFVGYLQRYNAKTKELLVEAYTQAQAGKVPSGQVEATMWSDQVRLGTEAKLPGANAKWRPANQISVHDVKAPSGGSAVPVMP